MHKSTVHITGGQMSSRPNSYSRERDYLYLNKFLIVIGTLYTFSWWLWNDSNWCRSAVAKWMKPCNALPSHPKHSRPLCPRGGSSRLRKCRPCRDTCESMHRSGKTHNGSITLQTGAAILNSTTSGPCRLWSCRIGLPSTLWCECLPAYS